VQSHTPHFGASSDLRHYSGCVRISITPQTLSRCWPCWARQASHA